MRRRTLFKACALAAGAWSLGGASAVAELRFQDYPKVRLLERDGAPLRAAAIEAGRNYVFAYPYLGTPCFLLRLDKPVAAVTLADREGRDYHWRGGVGAEGRIVAYSAICAHRMSHPARSISFISYRPDIRSRASDAGVIACCSEGSLYDPARGARVIQGPADQPLAAIALVYDARDDGLYADGILGGEMFHRYFAAFGERLKLDFGDRDPADLVADGSVVVPLEQFSEKVVHCGGGTV